MLLSQKKIKPINIFKCIHFINLQYLSLYFFFSFSFQEIKNRKLCNIIYCLICCLNFSPVVRIQVTVNSGGVVFFALFNWPENDDYFLKEGAAVIKFSSSRVATQSERLGYEFAKWLGVRTPQVVLSHSISCLIVTILCH